MIKIVKVPRGEAPEPTRQSWVGLELPLAPGHPHGAHSFDGVYGVVTQRLVEPFRGFAVHTSDAMRVLEAQHPEAARWWRENLDRSGRDLLIFREEECELVGEFPNH